MEVSNFDGLEIVTSSPMLIPAIDPDARRCADLPDSHVVKLPTEIMQMVSTAAPQVLDAGELAIVQSLLVSPTHQHHPYTKWVAQGPGHFVWTVHLGLALCKKKLERYPDNPPHVYHAVFGDLLDALPARMRSLPPTLPEHELPLVCAGPGVISDAAQRQIILETAASGQRSRAFRLYYLYGKRALWRFGGAAETRARKQTREAQRRVFPVPEPWASFVLTDKERAAQWASHRAPA